MKQPDLIPGVRDEERPTPQFDVPFALTSPISRAWLQQQARLALANTPARTRLGCVHGLRWDEGCEMCGRQA